MRFNRAVLMLGAVSALAMPSAAVAHDVSSGSAEHNNTNTASESTSGPEHSTSSTSHSEHGGNGAGSGPSGGSNASRSERIDLRGTVVSVDTTAQTILVTVNKANHGHHGSAHLGQTITFDVSSARLDVRDINGDGARDLGDVAAGDAVEVRAELPKSGALAPTSPIVAQRLKDRSGHHGNHDAQQHNVGLSHG